MIDTNVGIADEVFDVLMRLAGEGADRPAEWRRVADKIARIEVFFSGPQQQPDGSSMARRCDLRRLLKGKRVLLAATDVCR